ncbi:MAG: ABC transporter substrate-binding protein, partial [Candidatus Cybelea sp.]
MSIRITTFLAALLAAVGLAGCTKVSGSGSGSAGHPWTQPGVFRWSEGSDPKNLNPVLDSASPTLDLSMFIFSWAIRYDANGRPVPDALREIPTIANGDVSKDGLRLTYKLRPNIKWQDGVPLTCDDLKFT